MSNDLVKVFLPKDKDFVYCFFQDKIIKEEDCFNYEHNLECDKNKDFWGRTHRKGSPSGRKYAYHGPTSILNSCKYCIKENEVFEEYWLPHEVTEKKKSWKFW